jgi:hypothetical protein
VRTVKASGFEPVSRSSNRKVWVTCSILVALVAGWYAFFSLTRDSQKSPPRLIGSVWTAQVDGATRVYFVTKEDRGATRSFDTEGAYTYEHTYSIYTLHARDARSGAAVAAAPIARIETTSPDFKKYKAFITLPDGPGILGPQGELIWLWNNGPEARSLRTLEPVWTAAKLNELNPDLVSLIPDDPKYAKVLEPLDALVLKGQDARFFQVDGSAGKIRPVDEATFATLSTEHTKNADTAFTSLDAAGRSLRAATSVGALCQKALVDDGLWCALLTSDERASLAPRLGFIEEWYYRNWSLALSESVRSAFRGRYELVPERNFLNKSIQLDLASVEPMGRERFLMAGFLRRPGTVGVWCVGSAQARDSTSAPAGGNDAKSYLVLHRLALGEKNPWYLTRLGLDGAIHWSRSTGLTELNHLSDGHGTIILAGNADVALLKGLRPDRIGFIDEWTGKAHSLNVADGKLAPIE